MEKRIEKVAMVNGSNFEIGRELNGGHYVFKTLFENARGGRWKVVYSTTAEFEFCRACGQFADHCTAECSECEIEECGYYNCRPRYVDTQQMLLDVINFITPCSLWCGDSYMKVSILYEDGEKETFEWPLGHSEGDEFARMEVIYSILERFERQAFPPAHFGAEDVDNLDIKRLSILLDEVSAPTHCATVRWELEYYMRLGIYNRITRDPSLERRVRRKFEDKLRKELAERSEIARVVLANGLLKLGINIS